MIILLHLLHNYKFLYCTEYFVQERNIFPLAVILVECVLLVIYYNIATSIYLISMNTYKLYKQ